MSEQTEVPFDPQHDFLTRSSRAIEQARRDGTGTSPHELLRRIDARLDAARDVLMRREGRSDRSAALAEGHRGN